MLWRSFGDWDSHNTYEYEVSFGVVEYGNSFLCYAGAVCVSCYILRVSMRIKYCRILEKLRIISFLKKLDEDSKCVC